MDLHKSIVDTKTDSRIIWGGPGINVSYDRNVNMQLI